MNKPTSTLMTQASCAALLSSVFALSINAQDTSDTEEFLFEEIVVTAQKREQSIMDVPVAVTNIGEDELEARGFARVDDLAFALPNVSIVTPSDARAVQFTIRGITGQTLFPGAESSVGIFVDSLYLNNPIAQNFDILDIERVEVLRGPQGTLFGKNTAAGVINLVTKKPDDEFTGFVGAEYGNYDKLRLRGRISGPIVEDRVSGSLSAVYNKRDGYIRNTFLNSDLNTQDSYSFRGALRFTPSEQLEINLTGEYLDEQRVPSTPDSTPFDREDEIDTDMVEDRQVYGSSLNISYELENGISITSISAYRAYDWARIGDDDGTELPAFVSPVSEKTWQFSEELRIASADDQDLTWMLGLYYLHTDLEGGSQPEVNPDLVFQLNVGLTCTDLFTFQFLGLGFPPDVAAATAAGFCAPGTGDNQLSLVSDTYAAFGQVEYAITDKLKLTAGLRVSSEEKSFSNQQAALNPGFVLELPLTEFERTDSSVTPKFALSYQPNDDLTIYASASAGTKSGGFNTSPVANPGQLLTTEYQEENLWSYEIGVKAEFWDGKGRLGLAGFYIDYSDLQVFRFEEAAPGVFSSRIANAASATSKGIEAELTLTPSANVIIKSNMGYTDSSYDEFTNCGIDATTFAVLDCSGNRLTNAPEITGNINATYVWPIPGSETLNLMFNGEWAYRGETFYDVFNNDAARQGPTSLFNANITLMDSENGWSIAAYGQNLFNEKYITISIPGFAGQQISELGAPRTYGLRVSGKF